MGHGQFLVEFHYLTFIIIIIIFHYLIMLYFSILPAKESVHTSNA